jgi:protein ImuB
MVVCVHLPRFELTVAAGGAEALAGHALAIAPAPGGEARVGEVSGAAEAHGVSRGMALGEALARCPRLRLVAGDPLGAAQEWGRAVRALEGIGAALELPRAGLAYFESDGLRGLHAAEGRHGPRPLGRGASRGGAGGIGGVVGWTGGDEGVVAAARRALGRPARVGVGPTRFCALAAALEVRSRRAVIVGTEAEARRYLAQRPVALLGYRAETAALVEPLTRLGIDTLGELAAFSRDMVADRFGKAGVLARRLARGEDDPLRTCLAEERLWESLELEEAGSGPALERVLGVLVDRLLARPERRGRTLRALTLSARLVEGGTWRERVVLREALSDPLRIRLALAPRLALLPAPAAHLRLEAERFGPPEGRQRPLFDRDSVGTVPGEGRSHGEAASSRGEGATPRDDERLREAVAQARAAAGPGAALRAVCVDPDSRVPERRVIFAPFPG